MRRTILTALTVLAFCLLLLPIDTAQATNSVKNQWLAFYPDVCPELAAAAGACILCHVAPGNFDRNPYGADVGSSGHDFAAIESLDSDDDGRTNGEEILQDCSEPGNAVSPVEPATWASIKALFEN